MKIGNSTTAQAFRLGFFIPTIFPYLYYRQIPISKMILNNYLVKIRQESGSGNAPGSKSSLIGSPSTPAL